MNATATHVRITDDGAPQLITWREASDEVNAAQMGPKRRQLVRTMSSDDNGTTHHITYRDGRKVTIRPATDADQPAAVEAPQMWATARSQISLFHAMDADNRALCNRNIWGYIRDTKDGLKTREQVEETQRQYDFITFCPRCETRAANS